VIVWCCPRCRTPLPPAPGDASRVTCRCGGAYDVVAGIPDFRLPTPAWIDFDRDKAEARRLAALGDVSAETLAREVFAARPGWTAARIAFRTRQVVEGPARARREIDGWLSPLLGDGGPLLERLNQTGLFAGLLLGLASAEIFAFAARHRLVVLLPPGAPAAVERSFAALVPVFALLTLALALRLSGVDLIGLTTALAAPLSRVAETYGGVLAICLCDAGVYYLGIHPGGVMSGLSPLWLNMLLQNQSARVAGAAVLPHIATKEFFLWFVWQGGSGGTLALSLLLLGTRKASLRAVARVALLPSLFNVNEPLLFGVPVVLNPRLLVPFVFGPLVTATVAYAAFAYELVPRPAYELLWTLPAPLGALLACGDWRALVLALFNLALSAAIWWPFVRRLARE